MLMRGRLGIVALGLALLALTACGAGRADAGLMMAGDGDPLTFNFDENGNGSISVNGGPFQPLTGSLLPDPSNGGAPALTFLLPAGARPVVTGTQRVFEDAGLTILGDALRFTDATGNISGMFTGDRMIFYSALGGGLLADTGFPANIGAGLQNPPLVEAANGTFQLAASGPNLYNGVSQEAPPPVPEPSTFALLALGGGALAGWRRWRKRFTE
jgi:hypothetical protein